MKKILVIITILIPMFVFAQIEIRNEKVEITPVYKPIGYDSIKPFFVEGVRDPKGVNIEEKTKTLNQQFLKYVGQTIYFIPNQSINNSIYRTFFYSNKLTKIKWNLLTDAEKKRVDYNYSQFTNITIQSNLKTIEAETDIYKAKYESIFENMYEKYPIVKVWTPRDSVMGKYFKIIGFNYIQANSSFRYYDMLIVDNNNDTLYMREDPFDWDTERYAFNFILLGYYEKQKQKFVGNEFIFTRKINKYYPEEAETVDINSGELVNLGVESEWTCKSLEFIDLKNNDYLQLFLILKNIKNEEIKVRIERGERDKNPFLISYFTEKQEYLKQKELEKLAVIEREKRLADEAEKKRLEQENWEKQIIQKYGNYHGNLIIKSQVVLGMTAEMCKQSWGTPNDINTTIVSGLKHEQWVYSMKCYLYFENGKLTAIQN